LGFPGDSVTALEDNEVFIDRRGFEFHHNTHLKLKRKLEKVDKKLKRN